MGDVKLVVAYEPESECGAFYLDGKLVAEFDSPAGYHYYGPIEDAFVELFSKEPFEAIDFEWQSRWMASRKVGGYYDYSEYEGYWPEYLKDTKPIDYDIQSPDDLVLPGEEIILGGTN